MSPAGNRSRRGALPIALRIGLGLGFLLAVASTVFLVFTEQVRWLRFAVILSLWAALIAAFAVTFFRRVARAAEQKTEESKRTYELELHREISARREYEIGVSGAARDDAENRHREELAGLREQLDRLNTTLSGLLDGDLLFERLTLSAESTRVRQVGGETGRGRLAAMARTGQILSVPAPAGPFVGSPPQVDAEIVAGVDVEVVDEPETVDLMPHVEPVIASEPEPAEKPEAPAQPAPVTEAVPVDSPGPVASGTGHSAGISVADLLAAYGPTGGAPRRRRRAED